MYVRRKGKGKRGEKRENMLILCNYGAQRVASAAPVALWIRKQPKEARKILLFGFARKDNKRNKCGGRGANSNSRARLREDVLSPKFYQGTSGNEAAWRRKRRRASRG
jgi:hypothetical protein